MTIVFNIKLPTYQSRKCCQTRLNFCIPSTLYEIHAVVLYSRTEHIKTEHNFKRLIKKHLSLELKVFYDEVGKVN